MQKNTICEQIICKNRHHYIDLQNEMYKRYNSSNNVIKTFLEKIKTANDRENKLGNDIAKNIRTKTDWNGEIKRKQNHDNQNTNKNKLKWRNKTKTKPW